MASFAQTWGEMTPQNSNTVQAISIFVDQDAHDIRKYFNEYARLSRGEITEDSKCSNIGLRRAEGKKQR